MRILILSTHPPRYSAGFGQDVMDALTAAGHEVDFVSRLEDPANPSSSKVICKPSGLKVFLRTFLSSERVERIGERVRRLKGKKSAPPDYVIFNGGYEIHYPDENSPALPVEKVVGALDSSYDLVITLWWFGMITSTTLKALYARLKCPILIYAIDMAPITGGCFYFKDCRNFYNGCGNCPALDSASPNDFTHRNFLIKKENYSGMPVGFMGNSWMNDFAVKSGLFTSGNVFNVSVIINDREFSTRDAKIARIETGLPQERKVIFLARSSAEPRKGCRHIIEGVVRLWNTLGEKEKKEFEIITVGDSTIHDALCVKGVNSTWLGKLDRSALVTAYQSATFFLSASEDDAGPSMVNQSMMCGTPVIAFDNGTAQDVVVNGVTGFKSSNVSTDAYAEQIRKAWIIAYDKSRYEKMRSDTRLKAEEFNSPASVSERIVKAYKVLRKR